jgi:hypothetical protein
VLVEATDVHGPRMQVDTPAKWGLWGVEAPEVSSSCEGLFPKLSRPRRSAEEGASRSITGMQPTPYSVRSAPAFRRS